MLSNSTIKYIIILLIFFIIYYKNTAYFEHFKSEYIYKTNVIGGLNYLNDPNYLLVYPKYNSNSKSKSKSKSNSNSHQDQNYIPKIKFNPIITNTDNKYKLYGDNQFYFKPSDKIIDNSRPIINQEINLNIKNYANHGIIADALDPKYLNEDLMPIQEKILNDPKNNKPYIERTIKDIYDDLTNDGRLQYQQNLDNLEGSNFRNDFELGTQYGATRFDTYAVK
jgi:hypothetical protein